MINVIVAFVTPDRQIREAESNLVASGFPVLDHVTVDVTATVNLDIMKMFLL